MGVIVGANEAYFDEARKEVPELSCRRIYVGNVNEIPQRWPHSENGQSLDGTTGVISLRPWPHDLLSGSLDERLKALIATAPPQNRLNTWHEAGNLPEYSQPPYAGVITAEIMTAVHRYMHNLCAGTGVLYGPILCMKPDAMSSWMPAGMDWYGLDIYDWPEFHWPNGEISEPLLHARLDWWKRVVQEISGERNPGLYITETNSGRPGARAKWLTMIADWLKANGGQYLLTFWSVTPGAGVGPWLPGQRAVNEALAKAAS